MTRASAAFRIDDVVDDEPYLRDGERVYRRSHLAKTFSGALEGSSTVEMLSVREDGPGAGYVALEHFSGELDGRSGGFALLHAGTMDAAGFWADWRIVPGSGSGELRGIGGVARIEIGADGSHTVHLDYELAARGGGES